MASESGQQSFALELLEKIRQTPYEYNFFDVLRYLEASHAHTPRLGESVKGSDDPVYLRQQPSMAFASATISRFELGYQEQDQIFTWPFGIFGSNGPMPLHITEYAFERELHHGDDTFSRFADVFHHRMVSLLYRAWANTQPSIEMDRPDTNKFDRYVGAIAGLNVGADQPGDGEQGGIDERYRKLFRAGLYNQQVRSADGLETLLSGFFKLPFYVSQYSGDWLPLGDKAQFRLGTYGYANGLGTTSCLGEKIYDCQNKFSVSTGGLNAAQFERLLPGGDGYKKLYELVTSYVGIAFEWDLTLKITSSDMPKPSLGEGARLGLNLWLGDMEQQKTDELEDAQKLGAPSIGLLEVQLQSRSANHYGPEIGE